MLDVISEIQQAAAQVVKNHYQLEIDPSILPVQETRKEFEGDFTLVVFPLSKHKVGSPPQIGETVGRLVQEQLPYILRYNIIKGFVNFVLSDQFWLSFLARQHQNPNFLKLHHGKGEVVVVEYCSPNTNKPLHLGHLRNIVLGYSIHEILKANGYKSHPVCLFNDRGTAISKSMYAWQQAGRYDSPSEINVKGDLFVGNYYVEYSNILKKEIETFIKQGITEKVAVKEAPSEKGVQDLLVKWEAGDPETRSLWEKMNSWVYEAYQKTFKRLGVYFDKYYYESEVYQMGKDSVLGGLEKEVFYQKEDGSIWVDLTDEGLDEKLLLRSNGTAVYMTQDLAIAEVRYKDYHMNRSVYVVGNEQEYHFKVLFLIMKKLGKPFAEGMYHLSYGMVNLPSGKMKSREGTSVDADDLMDEMFQAARKATEERRETGKTSDMSKEELNELNEVIGLAGLKYFLIKVDPQKQLLFDPKESIDIFGHTGPFIQYAYTRTASIARNAQSIQAYDEHKTLEKEINEAEKSLLRKLYMYPYVLKEAGNQYNPSLIANYVYELAKDYNRFYHGDKIIFSDEPNLSAFRFALSNMSGKIIKKCMALLGIDVPEKM